jgi:hypothetical protein
MDNVIKENYTIIESNLIGRGFYSNASIVYNNGIAEIYPILPLNLIKNNLQYLMVSYYIESQTGLFLWFDDFADGIYDTQSLNDWVTNSSDTDANNWKDYVEDYLLTDYPKYKNADCYRYTNETFEWEGEDYYLWEFVNTGGTDESNFINYILTDTIDYLELNSQSVETDYTNHWCPYIIKFQPDGMEYLGENGQDILIKVTNTLPVIQDSWYRYSVDSYDNWDDYCENCLLSEEDSEGTGPYGGSDEYVYSNDTLVWEGEEYYLWNSGYNNINRVSFILTNTIDYTELYNKSIEANHYNMNCPYVAMLDSDYELMYNASEHKNDWLIKVVKDENNPGQAYKMYIDDFII